MMILIMRVIKIDISISISEIFSNVSCVIIVLKKVWEGIGWPLLAFKKRPSLWLWNVAIIIYSCFLLFKVTDVNCSMVPIWNCQSLEYHAKNGHPRQWQILRFRTLIHVMHIEDTKWIGRKYFAIPLTSTVISCPIFHNFIRFCMQTPELSL